MRELNFVVSELKFTDFLSNVEEIAGGIAVHS